MSNLLVEERWVGQFFLPDAYEERFSGELAYTPEGGVVLTYTTFHSIAKKDITAIHGVLESGKNCTLIEQISTHSVTSSFSNSYAIHKGVVGFKCLLIGCFALPEQKFDHASFSLTNMQEFFYPQYWRNTMKFHSDPIYSLKAPFGKMEVVSAATFELFNGYIDSYIHIEDKDVLAKIQKAFDDIKNTNPEALIEIKKDLEYLINLEFDQEITITEVFEHILKISNLFSLLTHSPVLPESISLHQSPSDALHNNINFFPTLFVDKRTLSLIKRPQSHLHMPVNKSNVDFEHVFSNWLKHPNQHSILISSIQNETGFRTEHNIHGEIILYATQLESISYEAGQKHKKYEYPLEKYGNESIHNRLMDIFQLQTTEAVGIAIGEIRNEISHVGRPKKWLSNLQMGKLVQLTHLLQLTIISYILTGLGLPKKLVDKYLDTY